MLSKIKRKRRFHIPVEAKNRHGARVQPFLLIYIRPRVFTRRLNTPANFLPCTFLLCTFLLPRNHDSFANTLVHRFISLGDVPIFFQMVSSFCCASWYVCNTSRVAKVIYFYSIRHVFRKEFLIACKSVDVRHFCSCCRFNVKRHTVCTYLAK